MLSTIAGDLLYGLEKDGRLGAIRANVTIWIFEQPWAMCLEESVHGIMRSGDARTLPPSSSLPLGAIIVPSSFSRPFRECAVFPQSPAGEARWCLLNPTRCLPGTTEVARSGISRSGVAQRRYESRWTCWLCRIEVDLLEPLRPVLELTRVVVKPYEVSEVVYIKNIHFRTSTQTVETSMDFLQRTKTAFYSSTIIQFD